MKTYACILACLLFGVASTLADTVILKSGIKAQGVSVVQTNDGEYLLLNDYYAYKFAITSVAEISKEPLTEESKSGRLPNFRSTIVSLSQQSWATNLMQIPATVIDRGSFRYVPYVSFRCGDDYEVNVYGDLKDPAAIEAGVYRKFLNDDQAKQNCLALIISLLKDPEDKAIINSLNRTNDVKELRGYSFEITPPESEDAYNGWWISVYSEGKMDRSRASEDEVAKISVARTSGNTLASDGGGWSLEEMKYARPQPVYQQAPVRISPTGTPNPTPSYSSSSTPSYARSSASTYTSSSSSRVYVRGYTRKDGTYVSPHTRSAPRRR